MMNKKKTHKHITPDEQLFNELRANADSEAAFDAHTSLIPLKKIVLRLLRIHTRIQSRFNAAVIAMFQSILTQLSDEIEGMYKVISSIRERTEGKVVTDYKSIYFPAHEEDFYLFQQEKFRGPFDLIKDRQRQYIPYIKSIQKAGKNNPFIEVGFGRGEFMELLRENGVQKIIGVETNSKRVKEATDKGFEAYQRNAVDFITQYDGTISGVSAFHVVEHMTFDEIFDLVFAAYQKMVKGGLVIFETPNPENLQVGSWSFYIDHTHVKKLPPKFLASIFEYVGFREVEVVYSSPMKQTFKNEIDKMVYGPFDYAIVAYK